MREHTVLLVEDDKAILLMLTDLLEQEGFCVCIAEDGQAAMSTLDRDQPDVVVSDVVMPRINGIELAEYLRERHIPVILTSASRLETAIPGVDFVSKPFDLDDMVAAISRAISQDGSMPVQGAESAASTGHPRRGGE